MSLFANPLLRYDAALLAVGLLIVLAGGRCAWQPAVPRRRIVLLLHAGLGCVLLLLAVATYQSGKNGIGAATVLKAAANALHSETSEIFVAGISGWETYSLPGGTLSRRAMSLLPAFWHVLYRLTGSSAGGFMLVQASLEIASLFAAGWLLFLALAREPGNAANALLLLLAYDGCFVTHYLALADPSVTAYSVLSVTAFWYLARKQQHAAAAGLLLLAVAGKELLVLPLATVALWLGWRGDLPLRHLLTYLLLAVAALATSWALASALPAPAASFTAGCAAPDWPLFAIALAACLLVSGGALFHERALALLLLSLLTLLTLLGKMTGWREWFAGDIRYVWPLPFLALAEQCRLSPARGRKLATAALLLAPVLAYGWSPLPLCRTDGHRRSPANLERYRPAANHPALRQALTLIPPGVPLEASLEFLPYVANRPYIFQLTYYDFRYVTKEQHPPAGVAINLFSENLLFNSDASRRRIATYLAGLLQQDFRLAWYADGIALLLPGRPHAATSPEFIRLLAAWQEVPGDAFTTMVAANRHGRDAEWRRRAATAGLALRLPDVPSAPPE